MNNNLQVSFAIAEKLCEIFKAKTAIEWERELSSKARHADSEPFLGISSGPIPKVHNFLNVVQNRREHHKGVVGVRVQSFKEWMEDEDAKRAKISAAVQGGDSVE